MKLLFAALLAWAAWLPMSIEAQVGIQDVHEVAKSTQTITQSISIAANAIASAAAATSSGTLNGAFAIELYNPIGNSTLNVGFDVSLSTTSTSVWYGREVAAGTGVYYAVSPGTKPLRVRSQNTSAAQIVTITQFK